MLLKHYTITVRISNASAGSASLCADGDLVRGSFYDQLEARAHANSIIASTNSDEGVFTAIDVNINTNTEFRTRAVTDGSNTTLLLLGLSYPNIPGSDIQRYVPHR